jgi:hypothetical protein
MEILQQTCIVRSMMKSKFISFDKVREEAKWIQNFLKNISCWPKPVSAICVHCNDQSAIRRAYSNMYNSKSRHIYRIYNIVKYLFLNGILFIDYV